MLRSRFPSRWVETRARQIEDPLERLRFLRVAAVPRDPAACRGSRWARAGWAGAVLLVLLAGARTGSDASALPRLRAPEFRAEAQETPRVWLVEKTPDFELFSNGLRIETGNEISGGPRLYAAYSRAPGEARRWRTDPAGIVFHASEGELAAFEPEQRSHLVQQGAGLLEYVRRRGLYHYVIDRFGRVHRVVAEGDTAHHAGHSVWADSTWAYAGLNRSFLGVAFEAQSPRADGAPTLSPAQVHAGRILVEMLRSKYRIAAGNCVTHAQVSVNANNFLVGYHTDWAAGFPFRELGLPDNYQQPLPALALFGFHYDRLFLDSAGARLRAGLEGAEQHFRQLAAAQGISDDRLRAEWHSRYRELSQEIQPR